MRPTRPPLQRENQFELMGNESRWRNSSSEVGIAEFPFSEPTIFPELPPFWFLFGGKSLTLVCRRLPFLSCCNADCCLIIAGNDAENCAFRDPTPNYPVMPPWLRKTFQLGSQNYRPQFGRSSFFIGESKFNSFFLDELGEFFRREETIVQVS